MACAKIKDMHMKRKKKYGYITPPRNALDDLASEVRKEKSNEIPSGFNSQDVIDSEEDVEDLVSTCSVTK